MLLNPEQAKEKAKRDKLNRAMKRINNILMSKIKECYY